LNIAEMWQDSTKVTIADLQDVLYRARQKSNR